MRKHERRKRDWFVRDVEKDLLRFSQKALEIELDDGRVDPTLLHDIEELVLDSLLETDHRERMAFIYRFLDVYPMLWLADTLDVAQSVHFTLMQHWGRYVKDDPRWKNNKETTT